MGKNLTVKVVMSNDVMEDSTVNKETASLNIFTGGIDFSVPGNGGQECWLFLDTRWRVVESFFGLGVSLSLIIFGYRNSSFPTKELPILFKDKGLKNALLIILTLVLGIEIGFKCATRSLMFLLNPCHITTALQIYMLAAPPSPTITTIFRIHLNFLSGALLALIFPVTNTRLLAFETEIYWIQHFFVLLVPYYLLHLGGVYTAEDFGDFGWTFMSYGILLLYHFTILQTIGMGVLILFFRCFLNDEVRTALHDKWKRYQINRIKVDRGIRSNDSQLTQKSSISSNTTGSTSSAGSRMVLGISRRQASLHVPLED